MILYYRETEAGDYLAIETESNDYYRRNFGNDHFKGRATAISENVGSVTTTGISRGYLRTACKRVAKNRVPKEWLRAIGY